MPEDAKAMAGFWVQGEHLFILAFKGAICTRHCSCGEQ